MYPILLRKWGTYLEFVLVWGEKEVNTNSWSIASFKYIEMQTGLYSYGHIKFHTFPYIFKTKKYDMQNLNLYLIYILVLNFFQFQQNFTCNCTKNILAYKKFSNARKYLHKTHQIHTFPYRNSKHTIHT